MLSPDFDVVSFLELIGWGDWFKTFFKDGGFDNINFADFVFGTLPFMLQLFFVIFLLNWIMGIIGDITKIISRDGRFF